MVSLRVLDADGSQSAVTTANVKVIDVPPIAKAGGPYVVKINKTVMLSGSVVGKQLEDPTYKWDLDGDGKFGETGLDATRGDETGKNPTFSAAGLSASSVTA